VTDPEILRQLARIRQVTAKYHDVKQALADGYTAPPECRGGMGFHYYNLPLFMDLETDPLRPEILIYAPTEQGLKLVAVEYWVADLGQPHPTLLGQQFDGPMPGHGPGEPVHYDLHAWIWQANPDGLFAPHNLNITCDDATHAAHH
jgi:hypothetical protein